MDDDRLEAPASSTPAPPERLTNLLARLQPLQPLLERSGSVQTRTNRRGTPTYVLRYREPAPDGCRRQIERSISLGDDPAVAQQIAGLLADLQNTRDVQSSIMAAALLFAEGHSRNAKRRWKKWIAQQLADFRKEGWINLMCIDWFARRILPGRPRGRKPRSGLW